MKQLLPNLKILDKIPNSYDTISNSETYNNPNKDIILEGYFQDPSLFPTKHIQLKLIEPTDNIIKDKRYLYFIHFRFGDFKNLKGHLLPLEYYKKALKKFDINSQFIILSDEIEVAKKYIEDNFSILKNLIYDNSKSRVDSLYYMSKCKGGICSNSTFSWMGAYAIEDKDVICMPKPWLESLVNVKIYPSWATLIEYKQEGGNNGKKILVSYATPSHTERQQKLKESALTTGNIDETVEYGPDKLPQDFKDTYKQFFEQSRGGGYWIWKAYIILEEFKKLKDDDILIYIDSDKTFMTSIDTYLYNFNKDKSIMVFQLSDGFVEKNWTKMDIFKKLNCDTNKDITDTAQIESGYCILRNNNDSLNFLNQWFDLCKDYHLISDEASIEPNFEGFNENRHDQSLLSCLAKLNKDNWKIQIEKTPTDFGNPIRNKGFPQLLNF